MPAFLNWKEAQAAVPGIQAIITAGSREPGPRDSTPTYLGTSGRSAPRRPGKGGSVRGLRLAACLFGAVIATVALADVAPNMETTVFFERGQRPVRGEVDFSVHCFGYEDPSIIMGSETPRPVGTYKPADVFSFSAKCPDYGCKIHPVIYLKGRHIDWCNLEGRADGRAFSVERYAKSPIDISHCKRGRSPVDLFCDLRVQIPR
jgi:hypothetical protein